MAVEHLTMAQDDFAREAFDEALKRFSTELTSDERKKALVDKMISLEDVQAAVLEAQIRWENSRKGRKTRLWLSRVLPKLQQYGNIMDVLVQQHPEYVSLAWGAMKFLFVVGSKFYVKSNRKADFSHDDSSPPSLTTCLVGVLESRSRNLFAG